MFIDKEDIFKNIFNYYKNTLNYVILFNFNLEATLIYIVVKYRLQNYNLADPVLIM